MFLTVDKSEAMAYKELERLGWKPEKINKVKNGQAGYPDFKCSNNRWVEVKNINNMQATDGANIVLMLHQMSRWEELQDKGQKIFLMFTNIFQDKITKPMDISSVTFFEIIDSLLEACYGKKQ